MPERLIQRRAPPARPRPGTGAPKQREASQKSPQCWRNPTPEPKHGAASHNPSCQGPKLRKLPAEGRRGCRRHAVAQERKRHHQPTRGSQDHGDAPDRTPPSARAPSVVVRPQFGLSVPGRWSRRMVAPLPVVSLPGPSWCRRGQQDRHPRTGQGLNLSDGLHVLRQGHRRDPLPSAPPPAPPPTGRRRPLPAGRHRKHIILPLPLAPRMTTLRPGRAGHGPSRAATFVPAWSHPVQDTCGWPFAAVGQREESFEASLRLIQAEEAEGGHAHGHVLQVVGPRSVVSE